MLFNTFQFAYFLAILLPLYWALSHRWQNALLLAASYYFYANWDPRFLTLLILSTVVDYGCGMMVDRIEEPRKRKAFVAFSMAFNLGMLGYFKYWNFFAESMQSMLDRAGWHVPLAHLNVILPIGISFYTFQSMSYVIDVYRREIKPTRNLLQFAAFVSFFPHLVAGPIMRPTTLLPQIERPRRFDLNQFYGGCYLIFWGLTKKVVVADNLALFVNDLFGRWETLNGGLALLAVYAFAFQIYCDFSGYTDAARGISKLLGIELALNFNLPYFATSPKDFWSRWHISLSTWLRDYLYIPLGGNRGSNGTMIWKAIFAALAGVLLWYVFGPLRADTTAGMLRWGLIATAATLLVFTVLPMRGEIAVYRNLMLTMVIGGLWHGAAWTFVVWGAYQGILLVGHRALQPLLDRYQPTERVEAACWTGLRMFVTFHLVCLGWLFFRAESMTQAWGMLNAVTSNFTIPDSATMLPILVCIVPLLLYQYVQYITKDLDIISRTPWYLRSVFYTLCFYAFVLGGEFGGGQFIYFQF